MAEGKFAEIICEQFKSIIDDSNSRVSDWVNEPIGYMFVDLQMQKRLDYRLRRNLQVDVINPTLLKYSFEYELRFTKAFFRDVINEAFKNFEIDADEKEIFTAKVDNLDSFKVPVYITDIINPRADFELIDADGEHPHVPNRNEAAEIWGQQLYFNLESISKYLADTAPEGNNAAENIFNIFSLEEYCSSLKNILSCLAWVSGGDTESRFQKFDLSIFADKLGLNDEHAGENIEYAFYKGFPTTFCDTEMCAKRYFCWIMQEADITGTPDLNEISQVYKTGSRIQGIYNKVLDIVTLAEKIQDATYQNRQNLRKDVDNKCEYEVVFEQSCPSINPLIYTRAYAKTRIHKDASLNHLDILDEYLNHTYIYMLVVANLVSLINLYADSDSSDDHEKAKKGIKFLNMLKEVFHTWRIYAIMDVVPEKCFNVRLRTMIHSDTHYLSNEHKKNRRYNYIKSEILRAHYLELERSTSSWTRFLFWADVRFSLKTTGLWCLRVIDQLRLKIAPNSFRYIRRGKGFMCGKEGTSYRKYRTNALSGFAVEYFFTEDCQTQHIIFNLQGTDLEISPELSYIKTRERVVKDKRFLNSEIWLFKHIKSRAKNELKRAAWECRIRRKDYLVREGYSSFRVPPEDMFGRVYLSDQLQFLHQYTTKELDERQTEYWFSNSTDKGFRNVVLPDGKVKELAYEKNFRPRPTFILGLRLKHEIRHAYMVILTALLLISIATFMLVCKLDSLKPKSASVSLLPSAAGVVATTGLLLMLGLVTFFLTSGKRNIFEVFLARSYRYSFYVLIALQTYLLLRYVYILV